MGVGVRGVMGAGSSLESQEPNTSMDFLPAGLCDSIFSILILLDYRWKLLIIIDSVRLEYKNNKNFWITRVLGQLWP